MEFDVTPFINAGISGAMLLWFMFRLERILVRFERSVQLMARRSYGCWSGGTRRRRAG